jgi:hypothetical protein
MPTETTCVNQSNPYIPPLTALPKRNQSNPGISDMPYPRTYGAPVGQGVWKGDHIIVLENERYYAAARVIPSTPTTQIGNLYAIVGLFFSHDCLSMNNFVSTSIVTRVFNSGFIDYGTACQNGTRNTTQDGKTTELFVDYAQGPNCTIYSAPEPTDAATTEKFFLELVQPLASNPKTECEYVMDLTRADGATPPSSNAAGELGDFALSRVKISVMILASLAVVAYVL